MHQQKTRTVIFKIHRYLSLSLGLIMILIGVTGSLLVFHSEIEDWLITQRYGTIMPQGQRLTLDRIVESAKTTYPIWTFDEIVFPKDERHPMILGFTAPDADPNLYEHGFHQVLVNPYTGKIMGELATRYTFYRFILNLHYRLFLPGEWLGRVITGIAALLLLTIAVTGIMLWPGWRKLSTGFKIKWNSHIKRRNFDLHKVIGIFTAVFLALTGLTGAYLSFDYQIEPVIGMLDVSSPAINSQTVTLPAQLSGQKFLPLETLVQVAQQALPTMKIQEIYVTRDEPLEVYGNAEELLRLNPYTGKVLSVANGTQRKEYSVSDRIHNLLIAPFHFGTFGGLPTRILYVFVGLAPLILSITGFIMWWHRQKPMLSQRNPQLSQKLKKS
jgi:uncharacterized iron-regulated membrane protein